jgi:hypothetical protein
MRVSEQRAAGPGDAGAGALVGLYRTEADRAGRAPGLGTGGVVTAAVVLARAGVLAGQPFVLGADGGYDVALNRFFRELDSWGVRAASSVAAYARC